ncbi:MAG: DUF1707 domain-containing protein [Solirubrobacteraceae bacterium]
MMHSRDVRASDLDRERAVEFLKAHYADGRLQHEELAARTDAAYRAVSLSELDWLTSDLPAIVRPVPRRRRHVSPVTAVLVCALFAALVVVVPPEAWLALLAIGALFAIVGFFLLAPVAVPVALLAGVVYLIVRATRPRPQQRRVGWR